LSELRQKLCHFRFVRIKSSEWVPIDLKRNTWSGKFGIEKLRISGSDESLSHWPNRETNANRKTFFRKITETRIRLRVALETDDKTVIKDIQVTRTWPAIKKTSCKRPW
jgi:hypothetical protein